MKLRYLIRLLSSVVDPETTLCWCRHVWYWSLSLRIFHCSGVKTSLYLLLRNIQWKVYLTVSFKTHLTLKAVKNQFYILHENGHFVAWVCETLNYVHFTLRMISHVCDQRPGQDVYLTLTNFICLTKQYNSIYVEVTL